MCVWGNELSSGLSNCQSAGERDVPSPSSTIISRTWFELLNEDRFFNDDERKEIAAAVGEWVDGDNIAAHVAYRNDIFCTEDEAGKGRPSILNADNRTWLASTYGIRFATLRQLNTLLQAA